MNVTGPWWWLVSIGSGNGLMPSGTCSEWSHYPKQCGLIVNKSHGNKFHSTYVTLLMLETEYCSLFGQYHTCWCPGSLSREVISRHGTDNIEQITYRVAPLWIWSSSVEQNPRYDKKCEYIFNRLKKNSTCQELRLVLLYMTALLLPSSGHVGALNERAMSITSSHMNSHHGSQHVGSNHALPYVPPSHHGSQVGSHYALPYVPSNHGSQQINSHLPYFLHGSQVGSQHTLPYGVSNREMPHNSQQTLPYGASNHTSREISQQTLPSYSAANHASQLIGSQHTLPHVSSSHGSQNATSHHALGSHHMLPVGSHHGLHNTHPSHQGSHAGLPYGGSHTPHSAPGRVTPLEDRSPPATYTQALTHTAPTVTNTYTGQVPWNHWLSSPRIYCRQHKNICFFYHFSTVIYNAHNSNTSTWKTFTCMVFDGLATQGLRALPIMI